MQSKAMTAEQFRAARKTLGLTQKGLADLMGVAENSITRKEGGTIPISVRDQMLVQTLLANAATPAPKTRKPKPTK